jgi:hypothetical protein
MLRNRFLTLLLAMPIALASPSFAEEEWRDRDCRRVDGVAELCRHRESIGIFFDDGAWVNGYCVKGGDEYDIEYEGLSKREAIDWVIGYCRY